MSRLVAIHRTLFLCGVLLLACLASDSRAETVARCGRGWLEHIDGYPVVHLKGTPYEMGYQHGALLKEHIRANLHYIVEVKGTTPIHFGPLKFHPRAAIETIVKFQRPHTPGRYTEELRGLAAGADVPLADVEMANFIPELFHCSGFAVHGSATKDGTLYHGRVLDYKIDWHLQDHAVLIVAEPEGGIPSVNVSYAGFIGSVTGMNAEGISIGEMGGRGFGHWDGTPMALLVREVLQTAHDLDEAIAVFRDRRRTCQYYYVIADGKANRAVGMEASWNKFTVLQPGETHPQLPLPVKDAVLLSAGERYQELVRRTKTAHGQLGAESALRLMDRGVAAKSNLHNVLFAPASGDFWVANASHDRQPAADQKYQKFNLPELLKRSPNASATELPFPTPSKSEQAHR